MESWISFSNLVATFKVVSPPLDGINILVNHNPNRTHII